MILQSCTRQLTSLTHAVFGDSGNASPEFTIQAATTGGSTTGGNTLIGTITSSLLGGPGPISHASSTASSNIRPSSADSNVVKRVEKQEAENQEKIERSGTHRKLQLDSPKKLIDRLRPKSQGHTTTSSREGGSTSTTSKEIKGSSKPITKSKTRTTDNNSKSETTMAR